MGSQEGALARAGVWGPGTNNCSPLPGPLALPGPSQAHGAAPQGARLPLQRGADDEVGEQEEGPVLLATNCLLWSPRQHLGPEARPPARSAGGESQGG